MDQVAVTRFPALHCFERPKQRQSVGSNARHHTIRGNIDTQHQSQDEALRRFANFVLSLVGDDEISFDFIISPSNGGSDIAESGTAQAKKDPTQATSDHNGITLLRSTPFVGSGHSEFGIIIRRQLDNNDSSLFAPEKSFVVAVDESSYSVRICRDLVPRPFLQSISTSLCSYMGWKNLSQHSEELSNQELQLQTLNFRGQSVLNHPPLMAPPDFESQLCLPKRPQQHAKHLLHNAFLARVRDNPGKIALDALSSTGRATYTYKHLDDLSSDLAEKILQIIGVDADHTDRNITVSLSTSAELYIAWLGILKAGCVVSPVPTDCPSELLQHMTGLTSSKVVLGSTKTLEYFDRIVGESSIFTFINVETIARQNCEHLRQRPPPLVNTSENDVAYILFTSGSTGKPKGVQITHHAAVCSIAANIVASPHSFESGPSSIRWFQMAAPTFDLSVLEIFVTFSIGGTICACDRTMMLTDAESVITQLGATITMTTPTLASLLRPSRVPKLREVWVCGEMLKREASELFARDRDPSLADGDTNLLNAYGPTEATITCTVDARVSLKHRGSLIGPPLPTCSNIILDSSEPPKAVPLGFAGELAIGGPQLSIGYLKSPEKTAAAFVDVEPYGKLYRTGDMARLIMGPDGTLQVEFLGRLSSDQLKILGRRVELGEIEAGLRNPLIAEVAVVALKPEVSGLPQMQLIAVVTCRGEQSDSDILAACQERAENVLQPHMRPSIYYVMDKLPRLASEKTDRKTLAKYCLSPEKSGMRCLVNGHVDGHREEGSSSIPMLQSVIEAVSSVAIVGSDKITSATTLLSLGIDSLRSVILLQNFRENGIEGLQVTDILTCHNLGDLNTKAQQALNRSTPSLAKANNLQTLLIEFENCHKKQCLSALGFNEDNIVSFLPVTTSQAVALASFLLTADANGFQAVPGGKAFIQHTVYTVKPELNAQRIVESWTRVLSRYDIMRSVFVEVNDDLTPFAQCILSPDHEVAQIKPQFYSAKSDNECKDVIQAAQKAAEETISLYEPPRRLSVVQSPTQTIIVFSQLHSVFDGGSETLLLEDIEREYLGLPSIERTGVLTAVERHFSENRAEAAQFWQAYMNGFILPSFPCLRSTVPGPDENGCGGYSFMSDLSLESLTRQAAALQCSPLSILQAAWAQILFTYTGERDVAFGNTMSDRFTTELANCSAPVLTIQSTRVNLNAENDKRNIDILLERTAQNTAALSYLHTPITGARFDTTIALQMYLNSGKGEALYERVCHPGMQNDLAVMIEVYPDRSGLLEFRLTYQAALLDDGAAHTMLADLARVTNHIMSYPNAKYMDPSVWTFQQEPGQLEQINGYHHLGQQLLHECVAEFAQKSPNAIALAFYDDLSADHPKVQLTYADLEMKATRVAVFLMSQLSANDGSKHVVPIFMEKCPELYITLLGILKAGAAWCPVDPSYPPARQIFLIEKTTAGICFTSKSTTSQLSSILPASFKSISVSNLLEEGSCGISQTLKASESARLDNLSIQRSDIAYVIFTSGTTGTPKGVPISHESASLSIDSYIQRVNVDLDLRGGEVRFLQFANYTFDAFVCDVFTAWRLEGTLVSATRDILLGSFTALANKVGATHTSMTPTFASTLQPQDLETLRVATMGGEVLPQILADKWKSRMSICNVYGPAETAINTTINRLGAGSRSGNIGTALPAVNAYVMASGYPVMKHMLGELVISGPQLSPGYWDNVHSSNNKFRWNSTLQCRVYHTGDYVRQLADGSFDFVGRKDDLVKIRGMRVELTEISTVCSAGHESVVHSEVLLAKLPGSTQSSLICFVDCGLQKSADVDNFFILKTEEARLVAQAVKRHATAELPRHMVPDVFIPLNCLPRNQSSKVNRKRLLEVVGREWSTQPMSPVAGEQLDPEWCIKHRPLLEKIQGVIKIMPTTLSRNTTLSELGVDSIGAIRLSSRLKNDGHNISAIQVLDSVTIEDLINQLSVERRGTSNWKTLLSRYLDHWKPLVSRHLARDPAHFSLVPTTVFQDGMLVETLRDPMLYWASYSWRLPSTVDIARVRQAWQHVSRNHDILKVSFVPTAYFEQEDQPSGPSSMFIQLIDYNASMDWQEIVSDSGDWQQTIQAVCANLQRTQHENNFSSPPWRVTILAQQDQRIMNLTIHHSLCDGEMLRSLMHDVACAYSTGELPVERCQVQEAVSRLAVRYSEPEGHKFWGDTLSPLVSQTSFEDATSNGPKAVVKQIRHRTTELQATRSTSKLTGLSRRLGASSLSPLFRVAFGIMLTEYYEQQSVLFGEVRSERLLESQLVGAMAPLSATYPVPFRSSGSLKDMVHSQQILVMDSIRYGPPQPSDVRKIFKKSRDEALYSAVYVLRQRYEDDGGSLAPWEEFKDIFDIFVDHEFALNVLEGADDTITISLSVDETLMSSSAQAIFLQQLDALLIAFEKAAPETSLSGLNAYFPRHLLSIASSKVPAQYTSTVPPSHYIETWAKTHPEWKAVEVATGFLGSQKIVTEDWTYKKLNETANQVANLIISASLHGRAIAVSLDRSLIAFAIIVGIMKSGNTYVPIEAGLPIDRKSFLLSDSRAAMAFVCDNNFDGVELPPETKVLDTKNKSFIENLSTQNTSDILNNYPENLDAYLLYTSGSTGAPKGVRVSRQNLSSFSDAWGRLIGDVAPKSLELGGVGKFLCLASRAFDVHIGEMFLAWRFGLCAVTGERFSMLDDLPRTFRELGVTHAGIVPSLLDQTGLVPEDAPHLVYLGVGGEKMTPRTQQIWSSSDRVALVNVYGPTEVTIGCSAGRILPDSDTRCIGHPLGDSVAHVLAPGSDEHVKKGMAGELVMEGSLVANGYLNRPDAKGFCDINGRKMYRTGDIVRMDADSSILFLGRKDEQVKVRGQRLELGEVSEVIRSFSPTDVDVVTLLLKHPGTSKQFLVSFVASSNAAVRGELRWINENYQEINNSLRQACEQTLPTYMVPDFIIPISFIPLRDTSAKTDAKALEHLFHTLSLGELFGESSSVVNRPTTTAPSRDLTSIEKQILTVVKSVVGQDDKRDARPESTLFQLGLDSVASVKLSFKLKNLGLSITVARLLQNPTIEELGRMKNALKVSHHAESSISDGITTRIEELEKQMMNSLKDRETTHIESIRPCMPLQEVLVAHTMSHGSEADNAYVSHMIFELDPAVAVEHVKAAWAAVVKNTELLRTCFVNRENDIVQLVIKENHANPIWKHVSNGTNMLKEELLSRKKEIADDIVTNIDKSPPVRFTLASCDGADETNEMSLFMLSIHHALYDMASIEMIFQDFEVAYTDSSLPRRPSTLPLLEHIATQHQNESKAKSYWTTLFDGYDHKIGKVSPRTAQTTARTLNASLATLESLCSQTNTTLSALIQGIFAYVLARTLKRPDLIFGVVLSGRSIDIEGIDAMAAPCISTIPQRLNVGTDGKTITEIIATVQDRLFKSMEYQYTSLRSLSRWLEISGPLFSSLFSFTKLSPPEDSGSSKSRILKPTEGEMFLDFELALECEADPGTDTVTLRTRSTMFDKMEELDALLEQMESLVTSFIRGENKAVDGDFGSMLHTRIPPRHGSLQEESDDWSVLEQQIRNVVVAFSDTLPNEVKRTTPFIKYGIDSITTIRFSTLLRNKGFCVSGADVLRNPSVAKLATHIQTTSSFNGTSKDSDDEASESAGIGNWSKALLAGVVSNKLLDDVVAVYPLTPLQAGMISATVMMDPTLYSHHHPFRLPQGTSIDKVRSAWSRLVAKHDILRTSFHEISQPRPQLVGAVHQESIPNWQEVATEDFQVAIDDLITRTRFPSISSFETPPVKATVLRSPEDVLLVVSLHHATYDGTSIRFIFEDLWAILRGNLLPERKPFYETAMKIHNMSSGSVGFWADSLSGYEGAAAIAEAEDIQNKMTSRTMLLAQDTFALEQWCTEKGVTIQTICQLAVSKAVCAQTKSRDVVLGQVHAARLDINGADKVAGPMLNTVPLRLCIHDDSFTNDDYLRDLQAFQNKSLDHLHASLSDIQRVWRKENGRDGQLFEVLFVFRKGEDAAEATFWQPFEPEGSKESLPPSHYDLVIEVHQKSHGGLELEVHSRFADYTTNNLMSLLVESFESIRKHPDELAISSPGVLSKVPKPGLTREIGAVPTSPFDQSAMDQFLDPLRKVLSEATDTPVSSIDAQTSIFSIGVDSIVAIRVAGACRKAHIPLQTMEIMRNAKIGKLCEVAFAKSEQATPNKSTTESNGVAPLLDQEVKNAAASKLGRAEAEIQETLPVLPGQEYHLASWLNSGKTLYEPVWVFKTENGLDADRLRDTWNSLIQKNDSLRTCFAQVKPTLAVQAILKPDCVDAAKSFTVQQVPENMTMEEYVKSEIHRLSLSPSSLYEPPVRIYLIQGGREGVSVLLRLHHALYDAWSMGILIDQLSSLYCGTMQKPCPPLSVSHFARFTQQKLRGKNEEQFWTETLGQCEPTILTPKADINTDSKSCNRAFLSFECVNVSIGALKSAARAFGITPQCLIQVAFGRMLSDMTESGSPVFGYYTAGRSAELEGIESLASPTLNMLPAVIPRDLVGCQLAGTSLSTLLQSFQDRTNSRSDYEQSRLRDVIKWAPNKGISPLFNAHLNILWNDEILLKSQVTKDTLLQPWPLGAPSDYASPTPLSRDSSVDGLDTSFLPTNVLFADVGPSRETASLAIGIGCDPTLRDAQGLEEIARMFSSHLSRLVESRDESDG